ncbi:MAG: cyclic nucleotide-binding domain-containing protein [Anaerolineae bacterium]|nr:cyclic nucleotide-binding domain-containing protein [Anaerolineae bacterium]
MLAAQTQFDPLILLICVLNGKLLRRIVISVIELLQRCELFSGLAPEQIEQVAALSREVVYDTGDVVIREGEPSDEMYVIRSGMVEILVSAGRIPDVAGPPQLTSLVRLGEGQFFGEMALVDRGVRFHQLLISQSTNLPIYRTPPASCLAGRRRWPPRRR